MSNAQMSKRLTQALQAAHSLAIGQDHAAIGSAHLVRVLLEKPEYGIVSKLKQLKLDTEGLVKQLNLTLKQYPILKKPTGELAFDRDCQKLLALTDRAAQKLGSEYLEPEFFILSALESDLPIGSLLRSANLTAAAWLDLLKNIGVQQLEELHDSDQEVLKKYTLDLTEKAKSGEIDPIVGRDEQMRRTMEILQRRTKNNPVLIGDPGVGKTAIVEGLAQRIINREVPESLRNKRILLLDLAQLVAGTKYRGEFESRINAILKALTQSAGQIICFIDELHMLMDAGASGESTMNAGNLLKPALARGELRCIGATTLDEYRKHIEKDPALERRFQKVLVDEPGLEDTIAILRGIKEKYALYHHVTITDGAIIAAAKLSSRYISDRQLPDKAIDLIDEAAANVRLQIDSRPEILEKLNRKIIQLRVEIQALAKETDAASCATLKTLQDRLGQSLPQYEAMEKVWNQQKALLDEIQSVKQALELSKRQYEQAEREHDLEKMSALKYAFIPQQQQQLADLQDRQKRKETEEAEGLLQNQVSEKEIAEVLARWTGIPVGKLLDSERDKLLQAESILEKRVIGQTKAIISVSHALRRNRSGLSDPDRPIGSFFCLGPTGVGKTELCRALAEFLFNDPGAMVRLDMSEYNERHNITRLIGAPPGYIGYEQGGFLTEAVRRRPYCVILFDEIEKAHPDVFTLFLQILDEGRLTDSHGKTVNFKHAVIMITSNLGAQTIQQGLEKGISIEQLEKPVFDELKRMFSPEFLNRLDEILLFSPLDKKALCQITRSQLTRVEGRLQDKGIKLVTTERAVEHLAQAGFDPIFGARPLKRVIRRWVENPLAVQILEGALPLDSTVKLDWIDDQIAFAILPQSSSQQLSLN